MSAARAATTIMDVSSSVVLWAGVFLVTLVAVALMIGFIAYVRRELSRPLDSGVANAHLIGQGQMLKSGARDE